MEPLLISLICYSSQFHYEHIDLARYLDVLHIIDNRTIKPTLQPRVLIQQYARNAFSYTPFCCFTSHRKSTITQTNCPTIPSCDWLTPVLFNATSPIPGRGHHHIKLIFFPPALPLALTPTPIPAAARALATPSYAPGTVSNP